MQFTMGILSTSGFTFILAACVAFVNSTLVLRETELLTSSVLSCCFWLSLLLPSLDQFWKQIIAINIGCLVLGASFGMATRVHSSFLLYLSLFCYFHYSEFFYISVCHGHVNFDSLMLNHGVQYATAFTLSNLEHFFSPYHFPPVICAFGFALSILGLVLRASALLTARKAFTHLITTRRLTHHKLVVDGIYGYMRHPGYCGWLIWVVSSQVLAGNPLSCVVFAIVTWYFFLERIEYEEACLIEMFGREYSLYKARVRFSGVPFIS
jgi:protein-S-isoprenylcysteine O-methyltransferase